jgi:pullulanase
MKKVLLLSLVLLLALPSMAFAAEETTVTIHYKAASDNVLDWNLWIWADGVDGAAHLFDGEDSFGQVATVTLSGSHSEVGFIVRTDNWDKDIADDRFITVTDGKAEIWLISGDPTVYTSNPDGETESSEGTAPSAMPKTGMGGTSIKDTTYTWSIISFLVVIAAASVLFVRRRQLN